MVLDSTIPQISNSQCLNCGNEINASHRFCGECGVAKVLPSQQINKIPEFARAKLVNSNRVYQELQEEAGKIVVLIARERLFLYMHWLIFIGLNLFGFWIAIKCYSDYVGDEMTKIMIASTPFLYVNLMTLLCLVPIKGTRLEISRLKERLTYVKFKMEFGHLL
jgi:ribosomal protein L32